MVGELVARVSGFGPLQPFLDDPTVEEIWVNDLQGFARDLFAVLRA
jgi:type IV secretory pathway ATPase VirB11/archaellum biosynthesis ATPase